MIPINSQAPIIRQASPHTKGAAMADLGTEEAESIRVGIGTAITEEADMIAEATETTEGEKSM